MSLVSYFKKMIVHADLFDAMTEKVGVRDMLSGRKDGPAILRRAANRCVSCEHGGACEKWLERTTLALEAPSFCKNHDLFERVKEDESVAA